MGNKLVVGNWKMYGSLDGNHALVSAMTAGLADAVADVAVCVPFPYLGQVRGLLEGSGVALGAQDVSEHAEGAYTGQVSASMLREFGCQYVIVGHSERRSLLGERDFEVAAKALAALNIGLMPIVCVGETLEERDAGRALAVIDSQLGAIGESVDAAALTRMVIAYEPVWAIGTGRSAAPDQVQEVLASIRAWLCARTQTADRTRVLYGGSVKPDGASELFSLPDCDGGLIGSASLNAEEFVSICRAAAVASR
jgi:triosephosphate isomerase